MNTCSNCLYCGTIIDHLYCCNFHINVQDNHICDCWTPKDPPNYRKARGKKDIPESIQEVAEYAKEINYPLDAEKFFNFYAQKGWVVGQAKMRDWRTAVRNWKVNKWGLLTNSVAGNLCVIDRKNGYKKQYNKKGQEVWLCEDCYNVLNGKSWGNMPLDKLEKIVLEGKAK